MAPYRDAATRPWLMGLLVVLLLTADAGAAEISKPDVALDGGVLRVSWALEGAFPPELRERIDSGIELEFVFLAELRRKRRRFFDDEVSQREVSVSVRYSNLTKMYRLARRVDGTVTEQDLTERENEMLSWMTAFHDVELFDQRDLERPGTYYVKLKGKLLDRYRLLFIPSDLETDWARSDSWEVPDSAPEPVDSP